jgi:16S rRNA (guanine527-N7)-methyltransferase
LGSPLTREEFTKLTNVSRETLERLTAYADLLQRWQSRMNLVAPDSLADLWRRHFLDSAQLFPHIPEAARVADLGSGGGFPGLVLAIIGLEDVTLIESNQRKCAFLREVARVTEAKVTVAASRVEDFVPSQPFEIVTARALAPLEKLLPWAAPLLARDGFCLFLKGRLAAEELTIAQKRWHMIVERSMSVTDEQGSILKIQELTPKGQP